MRVRRQSELAAQGRIASIAGGAFTATRWLTQPDGLDFSLSGARTQAAGQFDLWYKHHWEVNFVRSGSATLEDLTRGHTWPLAPGTLYCVGPSDRHRLTYSEGSDLQIVSVFDPPIVGDETHDADGAYPRSGDTPKGRDAMFVRTAEDVRAAGMEAAVGDMETSLSYLTPADGLGFSLHVSQLNSGIESNVWFKYHWKANLILEGECEVTDLASNTVYRLGADDLYLVGPEDRHQIRARTDVHILSVFDPPLAGDEPRDADGSFPSTGPIPAGPAS